MAMHVNSLIDKHGRIVDYMRISVTDLCNFRCFYCMPPKGVRRLGHDEVLRFEEICRVASVAASLGVRTLRLTGGEPLVRRGIVDLVGMLSDVEGIERLAMTTNASHLAEMSSELRAAGLDRVNISLDTLKRDKFEEITRGGSLRDVLKSMERALDAGFEQVKLNVVAMKGINDTEFVELALMARRYPVDVRFIEYMPVERGVDVEPWRLVPVSAIRSILEEALGLEPVEDERGAGPAKMFGIERGLGRIGFIASVSEPFCRECNRLRLSADGRLIACLYDAGEVDVKAALRAGTSDERLAAMFTEVANLKPHVRSARAAALVRELGG
jgi:cyclic pyranopterin phosphate synthase